MCVDHGYNFHILTGIISKFTVRFSLSNFWSHYATTTYIGAGTGPAGLAMAGPFSAEVET